MDEVSVPEAARILNLGQRTVRGLIADGLLVGHQSAPGRPYRIEVASIEDWKAHNQPLPPHTPWLRRTVTRRNMLRAGVIVFGGIPSNLMVAILIEACKASPPPRPSGDRAESVTSSQQAMQTVDRASAHTFDEWLRSGLDFSRAGLHDFAEDAFSNAIARGQTPEERALGYAYRAWARDDLNHYDDMRTDILDGMNILHLPESLATVSSTGSDVAESLANTGLSHVGLEAVLIFMRTVGNWSYHREQFAMADMAFAIVQNIASHLHRQSDVDGLLSEATYFVATNQVAMSTVIPLSHHEPFRIAGDHFKLSEANDRLEEAQNLLPGDSAYAPWRANYIRTQVRNLNTLGKREEASKLVGRANKLYGAAISKAPLDFDRGMDAIRFDAALADKLLWSCIGTAKLANSRLYVARALAGLGELGAISSSLYSVRQTTEFMLAFRLSWPLPDRTREFNRFNHLLRSIVADQRMKEIDLIRLADLNKPVFQSAHTLAPFDDFDVWCLANELVNESC